MFNKLNTKTLAIAFGVLLVFVILVQVFKNKDGDRNFTSQLFELDTAKISSIVITPKLNNGEIKFVRSGNSWTVSGNGKTYKADKDAVRSLIAQLMGIKAESVAATDKSDWVQYEITDTASTRVRVEEKGKVIADFRVGKFLYQQPSTMKTYVRLLDADEVYAVNGFLAMSFGRSINDFRVKSLIDLNAQDITKVTFTYPADSSFALTRGDKGWMMNQAMPVDSAKTAEYINSLAHLSSYDFAEDNTQQRKEAYSINIEGKNFNPIKISAFKADTLLFVKSSANSEALFDGKKNGLANRVFVGKGNFNKK